MSKNIEAFLRTKSFMKYSIALMCSLFGLFSNYNIEAQQNNVTVDKVHIKDSVVIQFNEIDYGIMEIGKSKKYQNNRSASGNQHYAYNYKFKETNDEIPAAKGITFGLEWSINSNSSSPLLFKTVWRFPKPIYNALNQSFKEEISEFYQQPGASHLSYYFLEEPFEVIPGEWWFEVYYMGKLIFKRKFTLKEII